MRRRSTSGFLIGVNGYDIGGAYTYVEHTAFAICRGEFPIAGVED